MWEVQIRKQGDRYHGTNQKKFINDQFVIVIQQSEDLCGQLLAGTFC